LSLNGARDAAIVGLSTANRVVAADQGSHEHDGEDGTKDFKR
jgi:hypothetical protein